jgi:hypothetical protein
MLAWHAVRSLVPIVWRGVLLALSLNRFTFLFGGSGR